LRTFQRFHADDLLVVFISGKIFFSNSVGLSTLAPYRKKFILLSELSSDTFCQSLNMKFFSIEICFIIAVVLEIPRAQSLKLLVMGRDTQLKHNF
jgi:hypothetical protein